MTRTTDERSPKPSGIRCPVCDRQHSHDVLVTRQSSNAIRRRRRCSCGFRFTTLEVTESELENLKQTKADLSAIRRLISRLPREP